MANYLTRLLILSCFLSITLYSQTEKNFEERVKAKNNFIQKYDGKWQMRWNEKTATPNSIFGYKISKYKGSSQDIAKAFISDEKIMLGISNVDSNVVLERKNHTKNGGDVFVYKQIFKGIPVLKSGYLIAVNGNGEIHYISGDYYPDININTNPKLNKQKIIDEIETNLSPSDIEIVDNPLLSIYPDETESSMNYYLVYKTIIKTDKPMNKWLYIMDGNNGKVISKTSLMAKFTGSGLVYQTNPLHGGGDVSGPLYYLYNINPRKLDGNQVVVYNDELDEASSLSGIFNYNTSDTHFDEVMAYYHSNAFYVFLLSRFLDWGHVGKVTIHVHEPDPNLIYCWTFPSTRVIHMSDGVYGLRDPAKEAAIICHEFMHIVTYSYNRHLYESEEWSESRAMDEAYSDFFALAYKNQFVNSSIVGEYVDVDPYHNWARNLINSYTYSQFGQLDLDGNGVVDEHDNSVIFSGALWDYRRDPDVDRLKSEQAVCESIIYYLDNNPSFLDGRDALIASAIDIVADPDVNDIVEDFAAHGIDVGAPLPKINAEQENVTSILTSKFKLKQNYPNPFNPGTQINYTLPSAAKISIKVYDLLGREIAELVNDYKEAGYYTTIFDASNLSSGIYFYRITAQNGEKVMFTESKKMIVIK